MSWSLCTKEEVTSIYKIDEASLNDFWSDTVESMIRGYLHAPYIGQSAVSVTESHSGDGTPVIGLNSPPVVSVTSVYISGSLIDSARYTNSTNSLAFTDGSTFPDGIMNVTITYTSGGTDVPAKVSLAAATMISAIAVYEGRAGSDGSLKYGNLPTVLGGPTAVENMGLIAHLEAIMHTMLDKYQVRIR